MLEESSDLFKESTIDFFFLVFVYDFLFNNYWFFLFLSFLFLRYRNFFLVISICPCSILFRNCSYTSKSATFCWLISYDF